MDFVVIEKEETASTQDDAREWLESNPGADCVWVRAQRQTQGRGRQGRAWQTRDDDLIVSCGLRLPPQLRHRPLVSLAAGHALYQAFDSLAPLPSNVFLKWPNDFFWLDPKTGPRKLGGILAESFKQEALIVGWGVNLRGSRLEQGTTGGYRAASLEEATGQAIAPRDVLQALQIKFLEHITAWAQVPATFESALIESLRQQAMAPLWGLSGRLSQGGLSATARGLDPSGALLVQVEGSSELKVVLSGEFTFFV